MSAVTLLIIPDNRRMDFDPNGSENVLGPFSDLPIPMPHSASMWTDPDSGKPVALWCDDLRIRPTDFATVLLGIRQYNADCAGQGTEPDLSPAMMAATLEDEMSDEDDDRG